MRARDYIRHLASIGRYHFALSEAFEAIPGEPTAVRAQLRRLKAQRMVAEPTRGFFLVVPPEYERLGCLPAEQFIDQLMEFWSEPYHVALLSAAERHGAAHQRPQVFQVMVARNRPVLSCGLVRVEFVARASLEGLPATLVNTPRGTVRYSTPEVTALELVGYPRHAGGLSNVATVLTELVEEMDGGLLVEAARLSPVSWAQRLGYLLELIEESALAAALRPFVRENARNHTPLRRAATVAGATRSQDWKLIVNAEVSPDL